MCGGTFAHSNCWETPLRVPRRARSSEVIEIWKSQREPSLVRSRVAKCASTLLIRLVVVKLEFVLVTLGDRHHLDCLVVIGGLVIIRRRLWMTQLKLWAVVRDSPRRSVEESTHREHLILAWIKGELHPCAGAPTRTSGECDSPIPQENIIMFLSLSLFWAFTFKQFILCLYIPRIAMLE